MKKRMVSRVVCLLVCITVITVAGTTYAKNASINDRQIATVSNNGIVWLQVNKPIPETSMLDTSWLHYDDGTCEYSYGLADGGYWIHEAIVLTPTELAGYTGAFVSLKVMHGDDLSSNYIAWIYKNVDHPSGDPLAQATVVATGTSPAINDWFYINFTTPYPFNQTDTVWIGVGWHQMNGYTSPIGFDMDTCAVGKSDWTWSSENGATWVELNDWGFPSSWGLWVGIGPFSDTTPPVTTITLTGTIQGGVYIDDVTATLHATDDMSGVNYTKYKIDNGEWDIYSAPVVIRGNGQHTIYYYSMDVAGNQETEKTTIFTIHYPILITINGGLGITMTIKNNGTTPVTNLSWNIDLTGGIILSGKNKHGTITSLGAGNETKVKDFVFGFSRKWHTVIVASAGGTNRNATGTVALLFVFGVK
jgi:hypothetical protein